jgi:lysyl-tRNA synthetase class 2
MTETPDWRPSASIETLRRRAGLVALVRAYFAGRGVLEVETPALAAVACSDPQIESLAVADAQGRPAGFLQTSPEYAMKRLLAAGSGDIFQLCRVFRSGELGRHHNPEFTLLEWYRLDFSLAQIMAETGELAARLLGAGVDTDPPQRGVETVSYQQAFERHLQVDPLTAHTEQLRELSLAHGLDPVGGREATRDELLDFLVATQVGPRLGMGRLTCLHGYPASQASLARLDPDDPRVAQRFELYAEGVELANGYVELADANEQAARFAADQGERWRRGLVPHSADTRLLGALRHGLPACAGVALGFDRLVMLALQRERVEDVMAFAGARA